MNRPNRADSLGDHANDSEPVTFAGKAKDERTRISLRHVEAIHTIKTRIIGRSYARLGEVVWQLLSAVRLSELHETPFDIADFGKRLATNEAILQRVVAYLEKEDLLCYAECADEPHTRSLALTETGVATIDELLEASAEAFGASFIYPTLEEVR